MVHRIVRPWLVACTLLVGFALPSEAVAQNPEQVEVIAASGNAATLPSSNPGNSVQFLVIYSTTIHDLNDFTITCSNGTGTTGCSASPSLVTLPPGDTAVVTVTFETTSFLGTGTIQLTADGMDPQYSDTGSDAFDIVPRWNVAVSAQTAAVQRYTESTGHQTTFVVTNTGFDDNTYTFQCAHTEMLLGCGGNPANQFVPAGQQINVTLNYDVVSGVGITGFDSLYLKVTGTQTADSAFHGVEVIDGSVTVTPDGTLTSARQTGEQSQLTFTVTNNGALANTFSFTCDGGSYMSCTQPSAVNVGAGASESVAVSFDVGQNTGTGTLSLSADGTGGALDSGNFQVPINAPPTGSPIDVVVKSSFGDLAASSSVDNLVEFTITNNQSETLGNLLMNCAPTTPTVGGCAPATGGHSIYVPFNASVDVVFEVDMTTQQGEGGISLTVTDLDTNEEGVGVYDLFLVLLHESAVAVHDGPPSTYVGVPAEIDYLVTNTGGVGADFTFSCQPTGECTTSPGTFSNLANGAFDTVTVTFTGSAESASESVVLTSTVQYPGNVGSHSASAAHALVVEALPQITVEPENGWVLATPNHMDSVRFDISYPEAEEATFLLTPACSGALTGCPTSLPSRGLSASSSPDSVWIPFTTGAHGTGGEVQLTVTRSDVTPITATGAYEVETSTGPLVSLDDTNPGFEALRGECLSISAGAGSIECDDYRVVYPFTGVTRMNRSRNVSLLYNSAFAYPQPVIGVSVAIPADPNRLVLDSVRAVVWMDAVATGTPIDSVTVPGASVPLGQPTRLAVPLDRYDDGGTRLVDYQVVIKRWYDMQTNPIEEPAISGQYISVDRRAEFGRGWWLTGYEKIDFAVTSEPEGRDTLIWTGSDGSARVYLPDSTNANAWVSQTRGRADQIVSESFEVATGPSVVQSGTSGQDDAYYLQLDAADGATLGSGLYEGLDSLSHFTTAFWLNTSSWGQIVGIRETSPEISWWIDVSYGHIGFWAFNASSPGWASATAPGISLNQWHFVVVEFDGSKPDADKVKIHIDNVAANVTVNQANGTFPDTVHGNVNARFGVGVVTPGDPGFSGKLGEMAIVDGALTAEEIADWFADGIDFDHPTLRSGWEWKDDLTAIGRFDNDLVAQGIVPADYQTTSSVPSRSTPSGGWTGGWGLPVAGRYLDLDGSEYAYLPFGQYSNLTGTDKMTWALWYRPQGSYGSVMSVQGGPFADRSWTLLDEGVPNEFRSLLHHDPNNTYGTDNSTGVAKNEWHFVIVQYDGTASSTQRIRHWVDGAEKTPLLHWGPYAPASLRTPETDFMVGGQFGPGSEWTGKLGPVAIVKGLLTDAEKADWWTQGIDYSHPDLVAGYRWDGDLSDESPLGHDLFSSGIDASDYGTTSDIRARNQAAPGGSGGSGAGGSGGGGSEPPTTTVSGYVRKLLGGGEVRYDDTGRHRSTVDRNGNETVFLHDPLPGSSETRLSSIMLPTPGGPELVYDFTYDQATGQLQTVSVLGGDGSMIDYTIASTVTGPADGFELDAITAPDGPHTQFEYDINGFGILSSVTDARGARTEIDYTSSKVAEVRVVADGNTITMPYEAFSLVGSGRDGALLPDAVLSVSALFDGARDPFDVADVTRFFVTGWGAVRGIRNALGDETWLERGDDDYPAMVTMVRHPNGYEQSAAYYADGLLQNSFDNAAQGVVTYTWDTQWSTVKTVTTREGVVTTNTYDPANGNRLSVDVGGIVTQYHYNDFGQVDTIIDGLSKKTVLDYRSIDGNLEKVTTPLGFETLREYDVAGRPTSVTSPVEAGHTRTDSTYYDIVGRVTQTYAANTKDGHWVRTHTAYAPATGDRLSVTPTTDHPTLTETTLKENSWTYDQLGRVLTETGAAKDSLEYDFAGNVVAQFKVKAGATVKMFEAGYDALNRLDTRTIPDSTHDGAAGTIHPFPFLDGPSVIIPEDLQEFGYDEMGNLRTATNSFSRITRTYTLDGLVKTDQQHLRDFGSSQFGNLNYFITYHYDKDRRRKTIEHPILHGTGTTTYGYDSAGLLQSVNGFGASTFTFSYDASGQLRAKVFPGGVDSLFWDDDGRLEARRIWGNGLLVQDESITRDEGGRVVSVGTTATAEYTGLGHLTYLHHWPAGVETKETYVPNGLGFSQHDTIWTAAGFLGDDKTATVSSYDFGGGSGRMVAKDAVWPFTPAEMNEPNGWNGFDLTRGWDPTTGNLLSETKTTENWDFNAESPTYMTRVSDSREESRSYYSPDGKLRFHQVNRDTEEALTGNSKDHWGAFEEYWYDALGRRVVKRSYREGALCDLQSRCGSTIERTIWDGDQILWETRQNGTGNDKSPGGTHDQYGTIGYVHGGGIDEPLAFVRISTPVVLHTNWRGLYAFGTNPSGAKTETNTVQWPGGDAGAYLGYEPGDNRKWFGSLVASGRDASGFMYRRNRYYDPSSGQFTQQDPIGIAGGLNLYGYANGDPINFSDPFGLCALKKWACVVTNFAAGFGDALSFGGTALVREAIGANEVVQFDSYSYAGGVASGVAVGAALGARLTAAAGAAGGHCACVDRGAENGTFYVDSDGNVIPTPKGGGITGSPDGRYIQGRDADGNETGVRKDGGHNPARHPDPRAQRPHGHVPGVTNPDGTPWLPIRNRNR